MPPTWHETHVSANATMHPWEDWAETFAHYLHIRDTLRTSAEFGLRVEGPGAAAPPRPARSVEPGCPALPAHRECPIGSRTQSGVRGGCCASSGWCWA
ncbi:putative zinc-binding metallopeptidase [Frankia sp. AiPa1]|nr:putative zinc-binding metallopeptidase [Frankia sp. AiPa1]